MTSLLAALLIAFPTIKYHKPPITWKPVPEHTWEKIEASGDLFKHYKLRDPFRRIHVKPGKKETEKDRDR